MKKVFKSIILSLLSNRTVQKYIVEKITSLLEEAKASTDKSSTKIDDTVVEFIIRNKKELEAIITKEAKSSDNVFDDRLVQAFK